MTTEKLHDLLIRRETFENICWYPGKEQDMQDLETLINAAAETIRKHVEIHAIIATAEMEIKSLPEYKIAGLLPMHCQLSHEEFIRLIGEAAIARVQDEKTRKHLHETKLTYGVGDPMARGVTYFNSWKNGSPNHAIITVCANGEESEIQLAGTTIHEFAHVLAGHAAGHGKDWKAACAVLGLVKAEAGGQCYSPEHFSPDVLDKIKNLIMPNDGKPTFGGIRGMAVAKTFKPCPMGIGTRGGKSRGTGSGSRLRLFTCGCTKVRVAKDEFHATCQDCGNEFKRPA